jgi:hypothetical protein
MSYSVKVELPLQPVIKLTEFANFKVGGKLNDATIIHIELITSYLTPKIATIMIYMTKDEISMHSSTINNFNSTMKKIFHHYYDESSGLMHLINIEENKKNKDSDSEEWIPLNADLIKSIMN